MPSEVHGPVHPAGLPGFVAAAASGGSERRETGPPVLHQWGLSPLVGDEQAATVSRVVRAADGAVPPARVADLLRRDPTALARLLPPFGAFGTEAGRVRMIADSMGFQPLFHTTPGARVGVLSSSALVSGRAAGAALDDVGVAVQSLLGWQLGQRTLLEDVAKLEPGALATLDDDGVRLEEVSRPRRRALGLEQAVAEAAQLLRTSLEAVLDDHPDAVLQLTGGMDSRLLLSAVPSSRRRRLRAMTLAVPGSGDVEIARRIAGTYGLDHEVHGLGDVDALDPAEAWDLCVADGVRLDAMADPVALAAQRVGERAFEQGVRISGLGGEVARGFYYVGRVRDRAYSAADAEHLASWRMFANESVEPGLLETEFARWGRRTAQQEVHAALRAGGDEWFRASDELYVRHRMQRWAGATDSAVSDQRTVLNPMLDPGFLEIADALEPRTKARSRFLAALQMTLDPELGRLPLEGRPAPATYAAPPWWQPATDTVSTARRVARKARQKVRRGNRAPAGGVTFAAKVVEHWRARPELLAPVVGTRYVRDSWVDDVLTGGTEPRPSSVAFLTNLYVVTTTTRG